MRIVSYNILNGGEGRADPLAEVIAAQRPDVVALVEAENLPVVERLANRLDMDFIHAPGQSHASALLSRYPIIQTINHGALRPGLSKSLLEATVLAPDGAEWTIGVLHLHARATEEDETRREQELAEVLDVFAEHRRQGKPHLLAGDFNANAPGQQIDPSRVKPSTLEAWEANGGSIPRRVVQRLLDARYVDVLANAMGSAAMTAGTFTTQHPGQRVDYVFAFGIDPGRLKEGWIETDRLAKYASDHFPIGVEIDQANEPTVIP